MGLQERRGYPDLRVPLPQSPTGDVLIRPPVREVLLPGGWGWTAFEEVAQVSWIHLNNLRRTRARPRRAGDDGQEREFAAGEHRPLSRIIHTPNLSNFDAIREMFLTRARMMEAGFFRPIRTRWVSGVREPQVVWVILKQRR